MAQAHNYFGFTPAGTQYPAQPSAYAAAGQATYVPAGQQYAPAPAQGRPTAYSGYDAAPTGYAYAPNPPARSAVVTVAVTPQYQAVQVKPTYSSGYATGNTRPVNTVVAPVPKPAAVSNYNTYVTSQSSHAGSYGGAHQNSNYNNAAPQQQPTSSNNYSGNTHYDAALYSAATNYYQQQQSTVNKAIASTGGTGGANSSWFNKKDGASLLAGGGAKRSMYGRPRPTAPRQTQLHYCEVCKISCAGPMTYREHLDGQKHKKKEAATKSQAPPTNVKFGQRQLKCDLCNIACTGSDAYTAHIRGSKHQKVVKLHQRLGKPIPSSEPIIVTAGPEGDDATEAATKSSATKRVVTATQIKFVGGTQLKSLGADEAKEVKTEESAATAAGDAASTSAPTTEVQETLLPGEKAIAPVGQEYIEETPAAVGKPAGFLCKLCDCRFNDPGAKNMHMKGRRHRMNYKQKVDPSLVVETKAKSGRREPAERAPRDRRGEGVVIDDDIRFLERQERFSQDQVYASYSDPRRETYNDSQLLAKHASIYPTEVELQAVQNIVTACEKALKLVSDTIAEDQKPKEAKPKEGETPPAGENRQLKGVMRVGELAKGLLLKNDRHVELVLLCTEKPTKALLQKVCDALPVHLKEISDKSFVVSKDVNEAAVVVSSISTPPTSCCIRVTSPIVREEMQSESTVSATADSEQQSSDVLDRQKCLDALAALRHAKWFQARASNVPSCVLLLRIMRDMKTRVAKLAGFNGWAMELLLERCLSTSLTALGPAESFRRLLECLSSGFLLPGSPGLSDPCEKESVDVFSNLTGQQREDITEYAQMCLRQMMFGKMHVVLGMEPAERNIGGSRAIKRPFNASNDDLPEEGADGTKKEKTDEEVSVPAAEAVQAAEAPAPVEQQAVE